MEISKLFADYQSDPSQKQKFADDFKKMLFQFQKDSQNQEQVKKAYEEGKVFLQQIDEDFVDNFFEVLLEFYITLSNRQVFGHYYDLTEAERSKRTNLGTLNDLAILIVQKLREKATVSSEVILQLSDYLEQKKCLLEKRLLLLDLFRFLITKCTASDIAFSKMFPLILSTLNEGIQKLMKYENKYKSKDNMA